MKKKADPTPKLNQALDAFGKSFEAMARSGADLASEAIEEATKQVRKAKPRLSRKWGKLEEELRAFAKDKGSRP